MLETLYSMESIDKVTYGGKRKVKLTNLKPSQNDILERAESLFQLLDDTLDGEVDEEEFVRYVVKNSWYRLQIRARPRGLLYKHRRH